MYLLVNSLAITKTRQLVVAAFTTAPGLQSSRPLGNHRITTDLANWIVRLLSAQRNDLAAVAEILACVIASAEAACSIAAANLGNHLLGTA